jgi:endo-1,4-beta-xylanase
MGAAINTDHLTNGPAIYSTVASTQYNLVTAENACKFKETEPNQGKFSFNGCDQIKNFTLHTMKGTFRGHNLCWGNYNPTWLTNLDPAAKKAALVSHATTVVSHYGDTAYAWDVVNEAVTDDNSASDPLKSTDWYPAVPDYIDVAFQAARAAGGKNVKLFYNDYNIGAESDAEFDFNWLAKNPNATSMFSKQATPASAAQSLSRLGSSTKSDRVYNMVKSMKARGIPIDGVGLQMHISSGYSDSQVNGLRQNIARLGALGLEVHITELDISYNKWDQQEEQAQAILYAKLLKVCMTEPACKNFETWGFTDASTWKGTDKHPLPFDENYKPKLAVQAMIDVLDEKTPPPTPAPAPTPAPHYVTLTSTCKNAVAISSDDKVTSVAACEKLCDANSACVAVDTDGTDCYLKSACDGTPGACDGWCAHKKQ